MKAIFNIGEFSKSMAVAKPMDIVYIPVLSNAVQNFVCLANSPHTDTTKRLKFRLVDEGADEFKNKILYYEFTGIT